MSQSLIHELSHHQYLRDKLQEEFPDADEETLRDTLEGMTNLTDMLGAVLRSQLDDLALTAALRARIADMQERLARIDARAAKKRELVISTMERADIRKITEADFTVSLRPKPPPLVLVDEHDASILQCFLDQLESPAQARRNTFSALHSLNCRPADARFYGKLLR